MTGSSLNFPISRHQLVSTEAGQTTIKCVLPEFFSDVMAAMACTVLPRPISSPKGYEKDFRRTLNLIKSVKSGECVSFTREQSLELCEYISELEKSASDGRLYRHSLTEEIVKFALISVPGISDESIRKMCTSAETSELVNLRDAFRQKAGKVIPLSPQLKAKKEKELTDNSEYKF